MTAKDQCLEALRGFIERSDRGELAEAQAAIIQFALASGSIASRSQAMADLQATLADEMNAKAPEPMQLAFYSVIDAMIDRTRDAVLSPAAEKATT